jgi:hypothetical protein
MSGAIPPLPQYVFMVWCSVKRSRGTYLLTLLCLKGSAVLLHTLGLQARNEVPGKDRQLLLH